MPLQGLPWLDFFPPDGWIVMHVIKKQKKKKKEQEQEKKHFSSWDSFRSGVLTCVPFYLFFSFVLHKPEQSASDLEDMKQVIDYLNSNLAEQRVRILNL